jgi:tRNA-splicing ligase RtcB
MNVGFTAKQMEMIATEGVGYIVKEGYGFPEDQERVEEGSHMKGADYGIVSDLAKQRGAPQLGTLGAGNHFAEVQKVDSIFDEKIAKLYGLDKDMVVIMLHSGSRGFGHQICSDYIRILMDYQKRHKLSLPDPELAYAHIGSKEAENYWAAMCAAINFAFVNRQIMTHFIRKSFADTFKRSAEELDMQLVYDLCHNTAKLEEHEVDGKRMKLYVHRKGATRAFGPGRSEIPSMYRERGQPVLIPGSMGTASYVLAGREESMLETFGSSCHGAGRVMSRHQALRDIPSSKTLSTMKSKKIEIRVRSKKLVSEEAEWAYKNVDDVVKSVEGAKISNIVARLVPLGVTKG